MTHFRERQHLRQPWLIAIILAVAAIGWWSLVQQIMRGTPVGNNPIGDWGVVALWSLTGIGLPVLIFWMYLETVVDNDRIETQLKPFSTREITADQIARFYARTYRPIRVYGGSELPNPCSSQYDETGHSPHKQRAALRLR